MSYINLTPYSQNMNKPEQDTDIRTQKEKEQWHRNRVLYLGVIIDVNSNDTETDDKRSLAGPLQT